MVIERRILSFLERPTENRIIDNSELLIMEDEDIANDANVNEMQIGEDEVLYVLTDGAHMERYAYLLIERRIAGNGITTAVIVERVLADHHLICERLFRKIFNDVCYAFQNDFHNRIIAGNSNLLIREPGTVGEISTYINNAFIEFCPNVGDSHNIPNYFPINQ